MTREPIAFMSYVRADDDHDVGRITSLRKRLEGEVKMQTGKPFAIFQDRNDISWGTNWLERIESSLASAVFLIPIITPSFFQSPACRKEFEVFLLREKTLGLNRLILPLYYVTCDELEPGAKSDDNIVSTLLERNWNDWREFRFKHIEGEEVSAALAKLAMMIKATAKDLDGIFAEARLLPKDTKPPIRPRRRSFLKPASSQSEPPEILSPALIAEMASRIKFPIPEARPAAGFDLLLFEQATKEDYYVYTRRFDEVVSASDLASDDELLKLYSLLSAEVSEAQSLYREKIENFIEDSKGRETLSVTLLCDNSGSMRGRSVANVAVWSSILVETFERASIQVEVLGYTTRAWKGGQSREMWLKDRKSPNPGRLNDLRHIIYKAFSDSARVAAPNLGVMLREGILKENIDGEALLWAYSRLEGVEANKKLIVVLADGAPVDDSTLSVNPSSFLSRHAAAAAKFIQSQPKVKLVGVGIGHDASSIYENSTKTSLEQVGVTILDVVSKELQWAK